MPSVLYKKCGLPMEDGKKLAERVHSQNMQDMIAYLLAGKVSLLEDIALSTGLETDFLNPFKRRIKEEMQNQYGFSQAEAGSFVEGMDNTTGLSISSFVRRIQTMLNMSFLDIAGVALAHGREGRDMPPIYKLLLGNTDVEVLDFCHRLTDKTRRELCRTLKCEELHVEDSPKLVLKASKIAWTWLNGTTIGEEVSIATVLKLCRSWRDALYASRRRAQDVTKLSMTARVAVLEVLDASIDLLDKGHLQAPFFKVVSQEFIWPDSVLERVPSYLLNKDAKALIQKKFQECIRLAMRNLLQMKADMFEERAQQAWGISTTGLFCLRKKTKLRPLHVSSY